MQRAAYWVAVILSLSALASCKEHKPELTCRESVEVFERNGQQVLKATNGVYLKKDFNITSCSVEPGRKEPGAKTFVAGGSYAFYWYEGRLASGREYSERKRKGDWPDEHKPRIEIYIRFGENQSISEADKPKSWWWQPAIPHKIYPIDLLPNFGLDVADPEAGVGSIKSRPSPYWAVRGTARIDGGSPYTTFCSMKSPPGWDGKNYSPEATKERDVAWLIQAKTYEESILGNTCRGSVSADNGKRVGAMIDVPGAALKDIDKIYKAVAAYLSEMTAE
ncbi:hypothetical protein [Acidovorax sp. SUPP3334]|uniref:hypothetical protein n=1 Tax=Acidovorax sp. SUPP3334 TaxID=2920881 RepID=UPI0023DE63B8|nr:hypothetical protein [Acidovorax sp. SUPP3334]GKT21583.1 hypothetical protein AVHM3334_05250 [Acidovorax sp. SUPP3334]